MIRVFAGDFAAQLITSEAKNYERFAHEWDSRGTVARAWTNKSEIRRARSRRVQKRAPQVRTAQGFGRVSGTWDRMYKEDQMVVQQERNETQQERNETDSEYAQRLSDEIQSIDDALEQLERQGAKLRLRQRAFQLALDELKDYYQSMVWADA